MATTFTPGDTFTIEQVVHTRKGETTVIRAGAVQYAHFDRPDFYRVHYPSASTDGLGRLGWAYGAHMTKTGE